MSPMDDFEEVEVPLVHGEGSDDVIEVLCLIERTLREGFALIADMLRNGHPAVRGVMEGDPEHSRFSLEKLAEAIERYRKTPPDAGPTESR